MTASPTSPPSPEVPPALPAEVTARWQARFRAPRVSLPEWAVDAPHRNVYASDRTGVVEQYAWDRTTGTHRQVTDRPNGTLVSTLSPDGSTVWWFADTDGDEFGVWMTQPFEGGPDTVALPEVQPAYPGGLEIGSSVVALGRSTDDGSELWVAPVGGTPRVVYRHSEPASVDALSRDGSLLVISHSEHGDPRYPALRVLRTEDDGLVADKWDGEGRGLHAVEFAPEPGDARLLVSHERRGREELLIWDVLSGAETEVVVDLPGEVSGGWYPDGSALLLGHDHAARSELYRYDLATGTLEQLETPPGVVRGATARPDGTVELAWSSSEHPPVIRRADGAVVLTAPGEPPPPAHPVEDRWVPGPGGDVHALLVRPAGDAPYATAFLLHGGPEACDDDSYRARRAAYVDAGYAVVHVNYRGSTGYGSEWRDALTGRPGLTELEDVAAVYDALVTEGVVDPARALVTGGSWGGFLTLLAIGTQPERWAAGIAEVPVADYLAAYEDEMEGLRAYDRALFGGSPDEVRDRYVRSSPLTYVDQVTAPVLVVAGANDPRCPIRQIDNYLAALEQRGAQHEVYRFDAGHGSLVVEETIRQVERALDFALRHVRP
ncbi:prolyl oligopeptidase family serine peptidase [Modestobacter sp. I12A-02628]|uniref:S9 family peptidase n=1 Tax=Goekera deserti TaxID=2497753 RepID=A0A7K3WEW3_9ACTN|nr:prolyl oligopeptidase family serine peptidase [Goekera deserti]MPQ98037.1 prolyl oligopeptidase family serine peptidase [Goekera deserti]NDI48684.1 prolyl oligopeptidase family serine peptidase [Goekera deserti]NEL54937.1 S9 family peptidase [Goekera deserti]